MELNFADGGRHWVTMPAAGALFFIGLHYRRRCPIRPPAYRDNKDVYGLSAPELWIQHDWGAGQICPPGTSVGWWNVKHQMGHVVIVGIGKVRFLRHHVAHRSRFQGGQFFLLECGF